MVARSRCRFSSVTHRTHTPHLPTVTTVTPTLSLLLLQPLGSRHDLRGNTADEVAVFDETPHNS